MTKQDWKTVEERLTHLYLPVELLCDGYRLRLELTRVDKLALGITFSIGGWPPGTWYIEDGKGCAEDSCEERRRFFRPVKKYVFSAKQRKGWAKLSRETREHLDFDFNKTWIAYYPWWTSFRALKRHLVRNNNSIELLAGDSVSEDIL